MRPTPRYDHPAIAVAAQDDIAELFGGNRRGNVGDMGFQIGLRRRQMRAISQARQGRCKHGVTGGAQAVGNPPPTPSPMPCAMNQYECRHFHLPAFPVAVSRDMAVFVETGANPVSEGR